MKNVTTLALLALLLSTSCGEKETVVINAFETPLVTGIHLRDENGQALGNVGAPNSYFSTDPPGMIDPLLRFMPFPNPSRTAVFVPISSFQAGAAELWITPANYINDTANAPNSQSATLIRAGGNPIIKAQINVEAGFNTISLNTADLPNGYYRIYLKKGEVLLWDNLLVQK